jgi:cbb3-type cytochrome oxidase maturation protein
MSALYVVLPLALLIAGAAVLAFAWVVRSGQLDDVDTPPRRILFDDEARNSPKPCARKP